MSIKARGSEILVNTYTDNMQGSASIDANPADGGFQIVWESEGQDGDGLGVLPRISTGRATRSVMNCR